MGKIKYFKDVAKTIMYCWRYFVLVWSALSVITILTCSSIQKKYLIQDLLSSQTM